MGRGEKFFQSEKIVINVKTFRPCGRPIIAARSRFTTDSKTYPDSIFAVFINNNQPAIQHRNQGREDWEISKYLFSVNLFYFANKSTNLLEKVVID